MKDRVMCLNCNTINELDELWTPTHICQKCGKLLWKRTDFGDEFATECKAITSLFYSHGLEVPEITLEFDTAQWATFLGSRVFQLWLQWSPERHHFMDTNEIIFMNHFHIKRKVEYGEWQEGQPTCTNGQRFQVETDTGGNIVRYRFVTP